MLKFSMLVCYIFVHSRSLIDILPNFNLLWTSKLTFFGPVFPRREPYFLLFLFFVFFLISTCKFLEIKVQKMRVLKFTIDWNSARCLGKYLIESFSSRGVIRPPGSCNILLIKLLDWLSGSQPDEGTQQILKKLEEPSAKQNVKTVQGGVLIDMENADTYGEIQLWFTAKCSAYKHVHYVAFWLTFCLKFLLHWFRCCWNEITGFVKCSESFSRSRIMGV